MLALMQIGELSEARQQTRDKVLATLGRNSAAPVSMSTSRRDGEMVLPDRFFFDTSRFELKPEGAAAAAGNDADFHPGDFRPAEFSEEIPRVVIEGHTSQSGDYVGNMNLSLQRANNVLFHRRPGRPAAPRRIAGIA